MINFPVKKLIPRSEFSNKFTVFVKKHPVIITFSNATGFVYKETIKQDITFELKNLYLGIASISFTSNKDVIGVDVEMY